MRTLLAFCAFLASLLLSFSVAPAASQPVDTFRVTTEDQESEHPYFEEGFPTKFAIDGTQGKKLILEKGEEYLFQMDDVPDFHPFYLSTSAIGNGSGTYSNGVNGNFAHSNQQLTFTPPSDAPDSLWYQCNNHDKMGWRMALVEDSSQASVSSDGAVAFNGTGVRINFSGTSGSAAVTIDKFNSPPDGTQGISESTVSQYRFVIEAGSDLSFDSNTEIRFDVSTLSGIGDASNVTVYRRSTVGSGAFTELSTSYESDADELVVATNEFSEFVFASNSESLPVELAGFDARTDGRAVQLTWQTASETSNAGFEVQRKAMQTENDSWTALDFVESKASSGTASGLTRYRFRDETPPFEAQRVAYRLKQVDTDGTTHFSEAVTVRVDRPHRLALHTPYPNPTTGPATIRYALPRATEVRLVLYSALGRRVATLVNEQRSAGREELRLEGLDLASGTYLLRLTADGQVRTRKLTIVR